MIRKFLAFSILTLILVLVSSSFAQTINTTLVFKLKAPLKKTAGAPVLIMLHGYGSNEEDLFDIANSLDERAMVFSLRAPIELGNNGYCWFKIEKIPDQQFKYDYKVVKNSRSQILSFISNTCMVYQLDSNNVFLMGFSQGAMLSYDIALSSPGKIKGVMALSGRLMEQSKTLSKDWTKLSLTGFFIAHGQFDNIIPIKEGEAANTFLKGKGLKSVEYHTYQMQHTINGEELNELKKWLTKNIEPDKKPVPTRQKK